MERFIRFAPNIFTLSNLISGVIALVLIVNHLVLAATLLILSSACCDLLDGRVARHLKSHSEFGAELDSLADVVSFGVVPALAMYESIPHQVISTAALILFPICAALRLARFNIQPTHGYFEGLPVPAAGILIGFFLWIQPSYSYIPYLSILLSGLMVSKIRVMKP